MSANTALIIVLTQIDGVGEKIAKDLISRGVTKKSDLLKPQYFNSLPIESQYAVRYPVSKVHPWDFIHSIVARLPNYIHPAGSYRRKAPVIKDVDLVTTHSLADTVRDIIRLRKDSQLPFDILGEYSSGDKKKSMIIKYSGGKGSTTGDVYLRLDLFKTTEEELPFAMLHWTGSKTFNIRIRAHAKKQGYKLNQYGLFKLSNGGKPRKSIPAASEREIMNIIGVTYKPPELRNG